MSLSKLDKRPGVEQLADQLQWLGHTLQGIARHPLTDTEALKLAEAIAKAEAEIGHAIHMARRNSILPPE